MPNVTLSVSDEMKTRMDVFSEVSWSDVCRNAILVYLEKRERDTKISDTENLKVISYIQPSERRGDNKLVYMMKIKNNEPFDIILDRVIFGVQYNYNIEGKNITHYDYPLYFFNMLNIASDTFQPISSFDGLDDDLKHSLFKLYDQGTEINWVTYGDIYYRTKMETFKSGFYVEGVLNDNIKEFLQDQMAI